MHVKSFILNLTTRAGATALAMVAAAAAVLVLAVVLISQSTVAARLENEAAAEYRQTQVAMSSVLTLRQAVTDAEASQRGYLLTGDAAYLDPYARAREEAANAMATLEQAGRRDRPYAGGIPAFSRSARERLDVIDSTLHLARRGQRDAALSLLPRGRQLMAELRSGGDALVAKAQAHQNAVRAERQRFDTQTRRLQVGLAFGTGLALMIALGSLLLERTTAAKARVTQAELTEDLRAARHRAEEADQAKSRFLATASHDMRQPLHALALYIAALDRRVEGPQAREILSSMDGAVRSMTRLFTALLDLARLEAGVLKPEPVDFAVGELLHEVATHSMDHRGARAKIRVVETGLRVRSDPDLLEVALRNLASNAVKHSKGGKILIGCRRVGDEVCIEIHDDGEGIPKEHLQRLFSEFVRGEHAGSTEGIGLGLAIVERMAKLLGHRLAVRSEVGRGTMFSITVPRADAEADRSPEPAWSPVSIAGARILVADDEPLALDAMRHALEDDGAQVHTAHSAEAARAIATERAFDLYVFDLNLGRDSGLELLGQLAAANGATPGLIVTGATTPEVLAQLRDAGCDWLTKPLTATALTAKAAELLARS